MYIGTIIKSGKTETNFAYSIMDGLLKTTVIDAKNNKQETFANGSGLTVKSLQYKHINPDTVLTTLFEYDDVGNIIQIENTGTSVTANKTISGTIGGTMKHTYQYDNLYRLKEAHGVYNDGVTSKNARYDLYMDYDNMHNIVSKKQQISQTGVQFAGSLNAGYELNYTINTDNSQQIAKIVASIS